MLDSNIQKELENHMLSQYSFIENLDELLQIDNICSYMDQFHPLYQLFSNETLKYLKETFGKDIFYEEELMSFISSLKKNNTILDAKNAMISFFNQRKNIQNLYYLEKMGIDVSAYHEYMYHFNQLQEIDESISLENKIPLAFLSDPIVSHIGLSHMARIVRYDTEATLMIIQGDETMWKWVRFLSSMFPEDSILMHGILQYPAMKELAASIVKNPSLDVSSLKKPLSAIIENHNIYGVCSIEELQNYEEVKKNHIDFQVEDILERKNNYIAFLFDSTLLEIERKLYKCHLTSTLFLDVLAQQEVLTEEEVDYMRQFQQFLQADSIAACEHSFLQISASPHFLSSILDKMDAYYLQPYVEKMNKEPIGSKRIENDVPIYDFTGESYDFLISVINATNDYQNKSTADHIVEDPKKWIQSFGNSTISCSYISNQNHAICCPENRKENALVYGFQNLDTNSILHMYQTDLGLEHGRGIVEPTAEFDQYFSPEVLKRISLSYNEITLNRRTIDGSKRTPDFILCYDDNIHDIAIEHAKYFQIPIYNIHTKNYETKHATTLEELIYDTLFQIKEPMKQELLQKNKDFSFDASDLDKLYHITQYIDFEQNKKEAIEAIDLSLEQGKIDEEEALKLRNFIDNILLENVGQMQNTMPEMEKNAFQHG